MEASIGQARTRDVTHRQIVLHDACFSQEALDAFNSGDVYLRAAQNGLARATEQYVKDIRVRFFLVNIDIPVAPET